MKSGHRGFQLVRSCPIATDDTLTANRRFRGIADMDRFSSRNDLQRMTHCSPRRSKRFALRDSLFDHLVGAAKEREREGEAERL